MKNSKFLKLTSLGVVLAIGSAAMAGGISRKSIEVLETKASTAYDTITTQDIVTAYPTTTYTGNSTYGSWSWTGINTVNKTAEHSMLKTTGCFTVSSSADMVITYTPTSAMKSKIVSIDVTFYYAGSVAPGGVTIANMATADVPKSGYWYDTEDPITTINQKASNFVVTIKKPSSSLATIWKSTIKIGFQAAEAVTISAGTGVSSVYLSSSSTATSGSDSGSEFDSGSTVYGFAKLAAGYNAPSTWTLVSGTKNSEGAIYNVGSVSAGSANFGTVSATIKTMTVARNGNGGASGTAVTLTYGQSATVAALSRTGYTFKGWNTKADGSGTSYSTSLTSAQVNALILSGSSTLYAQWTANTYTVTFSAGQGSGGPGTLTATYGQKLRNLTASELPTRAGFTFDGYYTSGYSKKYFDANGTSLLTWLEASNTTLYVSWKANEYDVTLDKQNGSGGDDEVTATYGSQMPEISVPTRNAYEFNGYFTEEGGSGTKYYDADGASVNKWAVASDSTLYAYWVFVPSVLLNSIDDIGEATYPTSRDAILEAESIYSGLDASDKSLFQTEYPDQYSALIDARTDYDSQKDEAVALVISAIDEIGDVAYPNATTKEAIAYAESLYEALGSDEKNETTITNYSTLLAARSAYDSQKSDAITAAISAIDAISKPFDDDRETQLSNARTLYDGLDEDEKNVATITNYQDLVDAEAADEAADLIEALVPEDSQDYRDDVVNARDAYSSLGDDQKDYISDSLLKTLSDSESSIIVMDLINEIGNVEYDSSSKALIDAANEAYEALSDDQKALVANYSALTQANLDYDNVHDAVTKVSAIGTIGYTSESKALIDEARGAYDALSDYQKSIFPSESLQTLVDDEKAYEAMDLIEAIGDINDDGSEERIASAREAYDSLSDEQKAILDLYPDFEKTLTDSEAARDFIDAVENIGTLEDSDECKGKIEGTRDIYDALSDDQKALIDDSFVKALEDKEIAIVVVELISNIGEVSYDGGENDSLADIVLAETAYELLSEDQKALVIEANYGDLTHDREVYDNVDASVALIEEIGSVSYDKESKEAIDAAREYYSSLTDEEKALVKGYLDSYKTLEDAEAVYEVLEKIETIGELSYSEESKAAIEEARKAYDALTEDQKAAIPEDVLKTLTDDEAAYEIIETINGIGDVSYGSESQEAIEEARKAYDALTQDQKDQVDAATLDKLTTSEAAYADMKQRSDITVITLLILTCLAFAGGIFFLVFLLLKRRKKGGDDKGNGDNGTDRKSVKVSSFVGLTPFVVLTSHYLGAPYLALYIIGGLTLLIWISVIIVHFLTRKKKAKKQEAEEKPTNVEAIALEEASLDEAKEESEEGETALK